MYRGFFRDSYDNTRNMTSSEKSNLYASNPIKYEDWFYKMKKNWYYSKCVTPLWRIYVFIMFIGFISIPIVYYNSGIIWVMIELLFFVVLPLLQIFKKTNSRKIKRKIQIDGLHYYAILLVLCIISGTSIIVKSLLPMLWFFVLFIVWYTISLIKVSVDRKIQSKIDTIKSRTQILKESYSSLMDHMSVDFYSSDIHAQQISNISNSIDEVSIQIQKLSQLHKEFFMLYKRYFLTFLSLFFHPELKNWVKYFYQNEYGRLLAYANAVSHDLPIWMERHKSELIQLEQSIEEQMTGVQWSEWKAVLWLSKNRIRWMSWKISTIIEQRDL